MQHKVFVETQTWSSLVDKVMISESSQYTIIKHYRFIMYALLNKLVYFPIIFPIAKYNKIIQNMSNF
jgi:hypothetical protein